MEDNKIFETKDYEVVEESCVPADIENEEARGEKKVNVGKVVLRGAEAGLAAFGAFVLIKKLIANIKRRIELKKQLKALETEDGEDIKE